jgi:hypothetical protein
MIPRTAHACFFFKRTSEGRFAETTDPDPYRKNSERKFRLPREFTNAKTASIVSTL